MKAFARKTQRPLAVLPAASAARTRSDFDSKSPSIRDSFQGWLAGAGSAIPATVPPQPTPKVHRLSVLDVIRVNHATIREGEAHRIWPPSVVAVFRNANVITDKKVEHYRLKDANLRKIEFNLPQ